MQGGRNKRAVLSPPGGWAAGVCDPAGRLLFVSKAYATLLDRNVDDVLKTRWQDLVHPDDLDLCNRDYDRLLREGRPYEVTCRILQPNHTIVWASFQAWLVVDGQGASFVQFNARRHGAVASRPVSALRESDTDILVAIEDVANYFAAIAHERGFEFMRHVLSMASSVARAEWRTTLGLPEEPDDEPPEN